MTACLRLLSLSGIGLAHRSVTKIMGDFEFSVFFH